MSRPTIIIITPPPPAEELAAIIAALQATPVPSTAPDSPPAVERVE